MAFHRASARWRHNVVMVVGVRADLGMRCRYGDGDLVRSPDFWVGQDVGIPGR